MAVTVIDKLVIELGLDPKNLTVGQKQALDSFRKFQEEALRNAKQAESTALRFGEVAGRVRNQVLGLTGALVGAAGIKDFLVGMINTDAALGRVARSLDTTPQKLGTWRNAAIQLGGTAESLTNFVGGISSAFQHFKMTGDASFLPFFQALGINILDANRNLRPFEQILDDLNKRFQSMDPAQAAEWIRTLGGDQGMVNMLTAARREFVGARDAARETGAATAEDVKQAQELQRVWNNASQAITRFARSSAYESLQDVEQGRLFAIGKGSLLDRFLNSFGIQAPTKAPDNIIDDIRNLRTSRADNGGDIRTKPGAGSMTVGTALLARQLQQEIPGLSQFTAFNDQFHRGEGAHGAGRALDFTLNDPSQYPAVAEQVRKKLRAMGVDATVLDEFTHPSAGATGPHIHVQFNSPQAAEQYARAAGGTPAQGGGGTTTNSVTVGNINVYATTNDPTKLGEGVKAAIQRQTKVSTADTGFN